RSLRRQADGERQRDADLRRRTEAASRRTGYREVTVITNIREERMLVVSDIHLGNPLYRPRRRFVDFLRFACDNGYAVCVNGGGCALVQRPLAQVARALAGCNHEFARFASRGLPIYYTVGNHDIALERFLDDWGVVRMAPFLNVESGDRRIRIEHGHLYD